jgi:YhcH/YjgK/YiaL family protein
MIYDELKNISNYPQIPEPAIDFIKSLTPNIELGRHEIAEGIYANVEEYNTKPKHKAKFELHKKYIDIQIILKGFERLDFGKKEGLGIKEPYNEERDIEFYEYVSAKATSCYLNGDNFVVLFAGELHAPQISTDGSATPVKKVVVKVRA